LRSFDHGFAVKQTQWHSPSNAHAYRLYVFKELCGWALRLRRVADQ